MEVGLKYALTKEEVLVIGRILVLIFFIVVWHQAEARTLVKVRSLGSSYKGKYIALEEYGHRSENSSFTRIRILDVWEDKTLLDLQLQGQSYDDLDHIRLKNRLRARDKAYKYKIEI